MQGKVDSFDKALPGFKQVCLDVPHPTLEHVLLCSLWGNRSDLSLSSGKVDAAVAGGSAAGNLLVDHVKDFANYVSSAPKGSRIIMVLDNCGAELLADLRLAWYLCTQGLKVALHVKPHPVFVSDATRVDVRFHIDRICDEGVAVGEKVRELLVKGDIEVYEDDFYTSPLEFPYAPDRLRMMYSAASLLIFKGDANYRRILCDRHFPLHFPFAPLVKAVTNTPLLAIRTCKSPVAVGLDPLVYAAAEKADRDWCVNGTCGMMQFTHCTSGL